MPEPDGGRDRLVACGYFSLHHRHDHRPFTVGAAGECRAVVCIQGPASSRVRRSSSATSFCAGRARLRHGLLDGTLRLLECGIPPPAAD